MAKRKVFPGRWSGRSDEPFVVFIIGFRVNNFFALPKWLWTGMQMRPMVKELTEHPEKGFLGAESFFYWRGVGLVQYWRSFEDLEDYARDKEGTHGVAWREFNKRVGNDGTTGIWHETYLVEPGKYEAVYGNMPRFGLANAMNHEPATGRMLTARTRMGGEGEPLFEPAETPLPEEEPAAK